MVASSKCRFQLKDGEQLYANSFPAAYNYTSLQESALGSNRHLKYRKTADQSLNGFVPHDRQPNPFAMQQFTSSCCAIAL